MRWSRESAFVTTVCVADLITTVVLINKFGAEEANPLMAFFLDKHLWAFILAKAAFCLVPLAFLEWARRRHPRFVTHALQVAGALYVGLYCVGVWKANMGPVAEALAEEDRMYYETAASPITPEQIANRRMQIGRG